MVAGGSAGRRSTQASSTFQHETASGSARWCTSVSISRIWHNVGSLWSGASGSSLRAIFTVSSIGAVGGIEPPADALERQHAGVEARAVRRHPVLPEPREEARDRRARVRRAAHRRRRRCRGSPSPRARSGPAAARASRTGPRPRRRRRGPPRSRAGAARRAASRSRCRGRRSGAPSGYGTRAVPAGAGAPPFG